MDNSIENIFNLYNTMTKLKTMLRQGWINTHISNTRIESIGEHIFGTLMLATAIYANTETKINLERVFMMLALHETEEIIIGDLTPIDTDKLMFKKDDGKKAVETIFSDQINKQYFLDIIAEFEACETPEAQFAFQCDKMEADLQAYYYRNKVDYDKIEKKYKENDLIISLENNGYHKIWEQFLQNDMNKFSGIFLRLAKYLEKKKD